MAIAVRTPEKRKESKEATHGSSIVMYGQPLVGKTTSLRNNPDLRVCLIDFDKNSGVVETAENITIMGADSFEDLKTIYNAVEKGVLKVGGDSLKMDFDLYAIDSFTTLENKIKDHVVDKFAPSRRREINGRFGAQSDWGDLQDLELETVREWHALTRRSQNFINVLWIGHDMDVMDANGLPSHIQLMLQGKYAAPRIMAMMDACFYMFKQEVSNPKDPKERRLVRGIYTLDKGKIRAEARMDMSIRSNLPQTIFNPDWGKIFDMMNGVRTEYKDVKEV